MDSELNRFHSQNVVEETDGLEKDRLNTKRKQNISQILTELESRKNRSVTFPSPRNNHLIRNRDLVHPFSMLNFIIHLFKDHPSRINSCIIK